MSKLEHFEDSEFACKCGQCELGIENMDPRLLEILDVVRGDLGRPMRINSAVRCKFHNANVGGARKSEHVPENTHNGMCTAVDIHVPDSEFLYEITAALLALDVPRLGLNQEKNFIHIGISLNHAQKVFFKY